MSGSTTGFVGKIEDLCKNPAFKKAVMDDMKRVAKEAKLFSFEQAKDIYLGLLLLLLL